MDGEWGSNTNNSDYGFRIYNPSVGKFLSVDSLSPSYPMLTPYQFASNSPISGIDVDGLEHAGIDVWNEVYYQSDSYLEKSDEERIADEQATATLGGIAMAGAALVYTGGIVYEAGVNLFWKGALWFSNPVNQETLAGAGGLAASLIDPDPSHDYPGNFDDVVRGAKLFLGKSHVIGKYANEIDEAYHMFKEGFGLGIPKTLSPSNQILSAMDKTLDEGGKIIIDLKDVSIDAAKKGLKSFDEAAEISTDGLSKITEWELSKRLRSEELFNNTLFKSGDTVTDGAGAGLKLIE